jgi:hypothetical protein
MNVEYNALRRWAAKMPAGEAKNYLTATLQRCPGADAQHIENSMRMLGGRGGVGGVGGGRNTTARSTPVTTWVALCDALCDPRMQHVYVCMDTGRVHSCPHAMSNNECAHAARSSDGMTCRISGIVAPTLYEDVEVVLPPNAPGGVRRSESAGGGGIRASSFDVGAGRASGVAGSTRGAVVGRADTVFAVPSPVELGRVALARTPGVSASVMRTQSGPVSAMVGVTESDAATASSPGMSRTASGESMSSIDSDGGNAVHPTGGNYNNGGNDDDGAHMIRSMSMSALHPPGVSPRRRRVSPNTRNKFGPAAVRRRRAATSGQRRARVTRAVVADDDANRATARSIISRLLNHERRVSHQDRASAHAKRVGEKEVEKYVRKCAANRVFPNFVDVVRVRLGAVTSHTSRSFERFSPERINTEEHDRLAEECMRVWMHLISSSHSRTGVRMRFSDHVVAFLYNMRKGVRNADRTGWVIPPDRRLSCLPQLNQLGKFGVDPTSAHFTSGDRILRLCLHSMYADQVNAV